MASLTILSTTKPSSTLSSTPQESKFPAKSQRPFSSTVKFRATPFKVCAFPSNNNDNGAKDDCFSTRRSLLVCISTLPFLFGFHEMEDLSAKALQSDTNTYMLIREEVRKVLSKGKAAGVLRLVFHDAGTFEMDGNSGGMNGSIVYELERPENSGLKKSLKILDKAKGEVDAIQQVSWADMIAVAGAEAVSICGGPTIPVQLGRLDSLEPDAEGQLPQESLDAPGLKQSFERKGLSTQELVALSGAHTLGSKGFGSPFVFDNSYYKILLEKPWKSSGGMSSMVGLPSDHALVEDDECLRFAILKDLSIKACSLSCPISIISLVCNAVLSCTLNE
ncbi:THYLAKOID LUMENAL 29 KDA PROTEIN CHLOROPLASTIC-RELATED [Salix purpurea]|uniref:L-ascorbate peroxidase n=1 Tax=Salix purpurea TaxID=77065 RepID=A0A9Q0Q0L6_SALPP|nr:THYLAKOID LUMENAL 29 KDA PROTEIN CHLOROPLASTIC-RELATED [Salix purpurea]